MSNFKKSVLSRSVKLFSTASKIAGHELTQKLKESVSQSFEDYAPERLKVRVQQAKILAESLSQLKGAAMKVGQLLSLDSSDLLPPEVIEVLSQLQNKAEPTSFKEIEPVLKRDLSPEAIKELHIEPIAFSAASIGQVHIAYRNSQKIALKVQYPGVRESVSSDLSIVRKAASAFMAFSGKKMDLEPLFKEFENVLLQETDYVRERQLMSEYRQKVLGSSQKDNYIIPTAYDDICSENILAMTFEDGIPLKQWIDSHPPQNQRKHIAHLILDLYCQEFFDWGLVQTDPNYGNFLVRNDSQLVLLDFGSTQTYQPSFIQDYCSVLLAMNSGDPRAIIEQSIKFQLLDPREDAIAKEKYVEFMKLSLEPFSAHLQPFNFADKDYAERTLTVGRSFSNSLKYSAPPKHILLLHRKLGGIFNIIRRMDVALDLTPYWQRMLGTFRS